MSIECTFPWTGMVINPEGNITVCCAYKSRKSLGHISDIANLGDFFLEDSYTNLRREFANGWRNNPSCEHCVKYPKGPIKHSQNFNKRGGGLQYLELTTSNVCNQTCATCNSMFSSKWNKLNSIFDIQRPTDTFSLSSQDIDKIIATLPDLKEVQIKGGEPFADMKNLRIINALADINPNCKLRICSNMQMIPTAFITSIKKLNNVSISASIDGIGARFDWIRGGDFEKVVRNMKRFYQETGNKSNINPCVSAYNVNNLREIWDYFKDDEFTNFTSIHNIVEYPSYHSPIHLFSQEYIDNTISLQFDDIRDDIDVRTLYNMKARLNPDLVKKFNKFTETMNEVRGFEWQTI